VTTEVNHSDLTGSDLHPPLGTSESASALAIADVANAILVQDGSANDVARMDLNDDRFDIGSSGRPIALKVYDSGAAAYAEVLAAGGAGTVVAPRGLQATTPVGTIEALFGFDGAITDASANAYHVALAGTAGGVARYAHLHAGGGSKQGFVFLGDTWLTRSTASSPNLDITGALTLEVLCAPLGLTQNLGTDTWLSQWGYFVSLADAAYGAPFSRARYGFNGGVLSASAAQIGYAHQTAAAALAYTTDPCPPLPGLLQHLCVTRDAAGTAIAIYVNGVLRHSATLAAAAGGTAGDTFSIGTINGNQAGYTYRGWMGGLAVISGELSAAQVLARAKYALGLPA
jgi:hypothetical protein